MKYFIIIFFIMIFIPQVALGDAFWQPGDPIVPCDTSKAGHDTKCQFNDFIHLANHLISFAIWLAVPLSIALFTYAGVLYATASGDQTKIANAHKIFTNVAIGLIIVLSAWLLVHEILGKLLKDGFTLVK